jgi:HD superfamily phosphohydrolase
MSGKWPQIVRDPIHDMIVFEDNVCDRLLLSLLNTREVQRLRRIKQLGFTELVFPSANHSRFSYSLVVDTPQDTPYKPYDPDADKPAEQIYVESASGARRELSTLSSTVRELQAQYEFTRYYFPAQVRQTIDKLATAMLGRR